MIQDLGITLHSSLSFNQQIMNTCQLHFMNWEELVQFVNTLDATKTIMCSLGLSRLDYCNSILSGSSKCPIKNCRMFKMQLRWLDWGCEELNIPLLRMLHWLPITSRIAYKNNYMPYFIDYCIFKMSLWTFNCVFTRKTTAFIIRPEHPQRSYTKGQVIRSANICMRETQQLERSLWWSSKDRGHACSYGGCWRHYSSINRTKISTPFYIILNLYILIVHSFVVFQLFIILSCIFISLSLLIIC